MQFKNLVTLTAGVAISVCSLAKDFTVDGTHIRYIEAAQVNGQNVLYISELTGAVSCYSLDGKKLWRNPSQTPAVMLEIEAKDIDGDDSDELLAASADGNIYCWDDDGALLWNFNPGHKVRFSEIAVLGAGESARIFAGGNDYKLYELSSTGTLLSKTDIEGMVRKIEAGKFLSTKSESIFLMTYAHDKFRWEFFGFIDPSTKAVQKSIEYKSVIALDWDRMMVNELEVQDINKDGLDELLIYGIDTSAIFVALDGNFQEVAKFLAPKKDSQRYTHVIGTSLLPHADEVYIQYGKVHYICDTTGKLKHHSGKLDDAPIFNDIAYSPGAKKIVAGGEVSGGNGVYFSSTNNKSWGEWQPELIGRIKNVEENLETLYRQALNFKLPDYQKPATKEWVMVTSYEPSKAVQKLDAAKIVYVDQWAPTEDFDRSALIAAIGEEANARDRRKSYDLSAKYIIDYAREKEATNSPFVLWTGHGTDPFYVSIDTMEAVLKVAPNTCYGFLYAEMHNGDDPRIPHFVNHYLSRLVDACRVNGKAKIYFRQKNMFWAASSHTYPWKEVFFSGKYRDVLVPAAEDTSSRTQDLNFAGRVGMFAGGYVDNFAFRIVDDNPTSWRPLTPGGQSSASPYLRSSVMPAAYGSRHAIIFKNSFIKDPGMDILFALMGSGALPIVEKDQIASIGSWHLIKDADEDLIHDVDDHHNVLQYSLEDENAVFSVAQMHWAGTDLPQHDFSRVALGVDYRWTNFVPELPNGMVPVAPVELENTLKQKNIPYTISNGRAGYSRNVMVPAKEFGKELAQVSQEGLQNLPVKVSGASWSAILIDSRHLRLIMADPGYLEPQDREVTISFGKQKPKSAIDILSGEEIDLSENVVQLTVPAGSLRFIDLTY